MKFQIKKLFAVSGDKSSTGAGVGPEGPPAVDERSSKVAIARGLALLFLAIPVVALAPWAGGTNENATELALGPDSGITASTPASQPGVQGTGALVSAAAANGGNGSALSSGLGYGSFPPGDYGTGSLLNAVTDAEEMLGYGTNRNRRFGAAGSGLPRGAGGALPGHFLAGPGSPRFASSLPFGGGSGPGGGNSPSASNPPVGTPSADPADPSPGGSSAGNAPNGGNGSGANPGSGNPPVPGNPNPPVSVVDDEGILAPKDDPVPSELLPPAPDVAGDPQPGGDSLFDLDPTTPADNPAPVVVTAVSAPGTGSLMLLALPLMLLFGGPAVSRRS